VHEVPALLGVDPDPIEAGGNPRRVDVVTGRGDFDCSTTPIDASAASTSRQRCRF
jgi:hypothetical protein